MTIRRHAVCLIDLNDYLASFPKATLTDKIGVTEVNEIILNSMPSICSRQAYIQGFDVSVR